MASSSSSRRAPSRTVRYGDFVLMPYVLESSADLNEPASCSWYHLYGVMMTAAACNNSKLQDLAQLLAKQVAR